MVIYSHLFSALELLFFCELIKWAIENYRYSMWIYLPWSVRDTYTNIYTWWHKTQAIKKHIHISFTFPRIKFLRHQTIKLIKFFFSSLKCSFSVSFILLLSNSVCWIWYFVMTMSSTLHCTLNSIWWWERIRWNDWSGTDLIICLVSNCAESRFFFLYLILWLWLYSPSKLL